MTHYSHTLDAPFLTEYGGGITFPQVFAAPLDQPAPSIPMFTDDIVFSKKKRGIFQVVALVSAPEQLRNIQEGVIAMGTEYDKDEIVFLAETTYIVHSQADPTCKEPSLLDLLPQFENTLRVVSAEEYKAVGGITSKLTTGFPRPEPLYYNPDRIYSDLGNDVLFAVVRWDRIVFARCRSMLELKGVLCMIESVLRRGVSQGNDLLGTLQ